MTEHFNVYDKNRQIVGHLVSAYEVTRLRRINSEDALTFLVPMASDDYRDKIQVKGHVMDERGQYYVINSRKRIRDGLKLTAQISCQHVMFKLGDIRMPYASYIDEAYGIPISTLLDKIAGASNGLFSFVIEDSFDLFDVKNWGNGTALQALNDTVNLYGVEIEPDNFVIHVRKKIGDANSALQYRIGKNIVSSDYQDDGTALVTRLYATMKDGRTWIGQPASILTADEQARLLAANPGAIVGGLLTVNYLISQYAPVWASTGLPYLDGEITEQNITEPAELLTKARAALAKMEQPVLEMTLQQADLYKLDESEPRPDLGDTVTCVDPDLELDHVTARIIELTEYPYSRDRHAQITIVNVMRKDGAQIAADLNRAKQIINDVTSGGRIRAAAFEEFARLAVTDVNASKTEIKYDTRGIILQSKADANDLVALTSNGIIVSTDGGATARTAITAAGVAAEQVIGQFGNFVSMLIGSGNNVVQINPNGIAAGHATFESAPFRAYMNGHIVARDIELTGRIDNSEMYSSVINAGTINGATINGGSINAGTDINVTRNARIGDTLFMGLAGAVNDRRIEFVDPSIYEAYVEFTAAISQLKIRSGNDLRIDAGLDLFLKGDRIILQPGSGGAYIGSVTPGNRIVVGSEIDYVNLRLDNLGTSLLLLAGRVAALESA
ncbi:hypothetical protein A3844_24975 [Paenibacillus helianthi]|uniref:Tail spike domain-containing protein n=1 Tax=Paenibacillus helianthi TaxID=1349432 RepID=A0ABX3EKI2_9BACL|nr:phage tail protein [Paenibacillus helianthi]OKP81841.1 hypothetical protein A3844_24975 [Paenibacillus helianthi]